MFGHPPNATGLGGWQTPFPNSSPPTSHPVRYSSPRSWPMSLKNKTKLIMKFQSSRSSRRESALILSALEARHIVHRSADSHVRARPAPNNEYADKPVGTAIVCRAAFLAALLLA